jgi:para-aminobenzoate synthetase component I
VVNAKVSLISHHNFVIYPDVNRAGFFRLYILDSKKTESPDDGLNYFCLIPYVNPGASEPSTAFYEVIEERNIHLDELLQNTAASAERKQTDKMVLTATTSKEKYLNNLHELKHHIQLGNIYEINYCVEFFTENTSLDPLLVFLRLYELSLAPFAALACIGNKYIISASPELYLRKEGQRLVTQPIKGTAKRGLTAEEDKIILEQLSRSEKERTENVMAVDVARNDFSILATRGSVLVENLFKVETYKTVHQMVSTVSCILKEGVVYSDIIKATFPMASMTGAPKVSAMNLIDAYEDFNRSMYSGAMGFLKAGGDFELSVNIRCIFYDQEIKRLSIAVGSAITYLCEPEREYEECLLKAQGLLAALRASIK